MHAPSYVVHDAADRAMLANAGVIGLNHGIHTRDDWRTDSPSSGPLDVWRARQPYGSDAYESPENICMILTRSNSRQQGRFLAS